MSVCGAFCLFYGRGRSHATTVRPEARVHTLSHSIREIHKQLTITVSHKLWRQAHGAIASTRAPH